MKKTYSLIIAFLMAFSVCVTGSADSYTNSDLTARDPVIYLSGDSTEIAYDNGSKTFRIDRTNELFSDSDDSDIREAVINVLQPFLLEGLLFNKWDNYYATLEKEIGDIFSPVAMDENGDPKPGTDIKKESADRMAYTLHRNLTESDGGYKEKSYEFFYDWRMDPMEVADQLNDYIEGVKAVTGHSQVNLSVRCLGCNVALAYAAKYGTGSLHGLAIDVATSLGADFLGGMLSGDFGFDGYAISRFLRDMNLYSDAGIDEFVMASLELLASSGLTDLSLKVLRATLYDRIEAGVISALGTGTVMTMPCYWGLVPYEQFDQAVTNVFGLEGSEKRAQYAGLIEKITVYNDEIKKNVLPIMRGISEDGVNLAVISKYGTQLLPVLKDGSKVSDFYVSAARSSFGATTSDVYGCLSDEYIAQRSALGLGKYISPDRQIDASTCLFPDFTWFFKGVQHGYYTREESDLMMRVLDADTQLTIDDFEWTQFVMYDFSSHTAAPMDETNCDDLTWTADAATERPQNVFERIRAYFIKLTNWYRALFQLCDKLIAQQTVKK